MPVVPGFFENYFFGWTFSEKSFAKSLTHSARLRISQDGDSYILQKIQAIYYKCRLAVMQGGAFAFLSLPICAVWVTYMYVED